MAYRVACHRVLGVTFRVNGRVHGRVVLILQRVWRGRAPSPPSEAVVRARIVWTPDRFKYQLDSHFLPPFIPLNAIPLV